MYYKLKLQKWPILFSILVLFICLVFSGIMSAILPVEPIYSNPFYMAIGAVLIAILINKPKGLYLTSKPNWNKFYYYLVPLVAIFLVPFLYGGYKSFPDKWHIISMMFVGTAEEIIMHGIGMGCMVIAWGPTRKGLVKAAIISSMIFGLVHLLAISQDPGDIHWIYFKVATVFFAFLISMCFAGLVHETNTVWFAAFIHGLADSVIGNIGDPDKLNSIMTNWGITESIVSILITLPLGLFGYWLIVKDFRKENTYQLNA